MNTNTNQQTYTTNTYTHSFINVGKIRPSHTKNTHDYVLKKYEMDLN